MGNLFGAFNVGFLIALAIHWGIVGWKGQNGCPSIGATLLSICFASIASMQLYILICG